MSVTGIEPVRETCLTAAPLPHVYQFHHTDVSGWPHPQSLYTIGISCPHSECADGCCSCRTENHEVEQ